MTKTRGSIPLTADQMPRFDLSATFPDDDALLKERALLNTSGRPIKATLYYRDMVTVSLGFVWETVLLYLVGCVQNWHGGDGRVVYVVYKRPRRRKLSGSYFGNGHDLVIVDGWQPEFPNYVERRQGPLVTKTPRFEQLSPDWNVSFEHFVKQLSATCIVDCRSLQLGRVSPLGPPSRQKVRDSEALKETSVLEKQVDGFIEGAPTVVELDRFERDPKARRACISHFGAKCQVCQFDFGVMYPGLGEGFIEVHHLTPLSDLREEHSVDPVKDLCPVCCNCHAMLHKKRPPYTPDELRRILARKDARGTELDEDDVPF